MTPHYATCLQSIPGRGAKPTVDRATLIRATERQLAALRDAGLPTEHAEAQVRKLEEAK